MNEILDQIQQFPELKEEIVFVKFKYIETKDLLKHFLTLITATLVFSATFSEKIINYQNATSFQKFCLYASWTAIVLSIGLCGFSLSTNYDAALLAMEKIGGLKNESFKQKAQWSISLQDWSALLYGLGLTLLISSSVLNMKKNKVSKE